MAQNARRSHRGENNGGEEVRDITNRWTDRGVREERGRKREWEKIGEEREKRFLPLARGREVQEREVML